MCYYECAIVFRCENTLQLLRPLVSKRSIDTSNNHHRNAYHKFLSFNVAIANSSKFTVHLSLFIPKWQKLMTLNVLYAYNWIECWIIGFIEINWFPLYSVDSHWWILHIFGRSHIGQAHVAFSHNHKQWKYWGKNAHCHIFIFYQNILFWGRLAESILLTAVVITAIPHNKMLLETIPLWPMMANANIFHIHVSML